MGSLWSADNRGKITNGTKRNLSLLRSGRSNVASAVFSGRLVGAT